MSRRAPVTSDCLSAAACQPGSLRPNFSSASNALPRQSQPVFQRVATLNIILINRQRQPRSALIDYDKFRADMPIIKPVVFISSTSKDLPEHREAAAKAARQAGFEASMMEDFEAQSLKPPYPACMEKVRGCDV